MIIEKTLREIADLAGGSLEGDGSVIIRNVASIEDAGDGDLAFLADPRKARLLASTRASAVIVKKAGERPQGLNLVVVDDPQAAFSKMVGIFRPEALPAPGVHPKAEVHVEASIGKGSSVGAFSVVEAGASIGERAILYPGVYVGRGAVIGEGSVLHAGVAVGEGSIIGRRVIIHCNAVIGSDGFGYAFINGSYQKIPQRGIVRIGDDAEIGACTTIDRATLGETVIGRGTKIDNLVQVAHNVRIGEDAVIAAQTGIAGSARVGNRVQFAGQVGVNGHIEVGDGSIASAKTGVHASAPPGSVLGGMPAIPHHDWLKSSAVFAHLPEMKKRIIELEKRLNELEEAKKGGSSG